MDIDRSKLFSEWNNVACREQEDGSYICYECKFNLDRDRYLSDINIAIYHLSLHKEAGHKMWSFVLPSLILKKKIKEEAVTTVEVHYAISNNGDGSVSVHFFKTAEEASKFDEDQDEGWGEPSDSSEILHFDKDGILINSSD